MSINGSSTLKILVVEDSPGDVFLIKFYLEELDSDGYIIESVDRLEDAHKLLSNEYFDAVLLDFNLPDSEGMVTLTSSVAKFPDQIFIVLTGYADEKMGIAAVNEGAQDFLVKGQINSEVLDSSIKFAVNRLKLTSRLNLYAEALKVIESLSNTSAFILSKRENTLDHGKSLKESLGLKEDLKNAEELCKLFENGNDISDKIKNLKDEEVATIHTSSQGQNFLIKLKKGDNKNLIIGLVSQLF